MALCRAAFPGSVDPSFEAGCRAVVTGGPAPHQPVRGGDQPGARPQSTPADAAVACVPAGWLTRPAAECVAHHAGLPPVLVPWHGPTDLVLAPWHNAPIYSFSVLTHTDGHACTGEHAQIDAIDGTVRSMGRFFVTHCAPAGLPAPAPTRHRPRR